MEKRAALFRVSGRVEETANGMKDKDRIMGLLIAATLTKFWHPRSALFGDFQR